MGEIKAATKKWHQSFHPKVSNHPFCCSQRVLFTGDSTQDLEPSLFQLKAGQGLNCYYIITIT